ncbi:MAG: DNA-3-methyladenine glycosylase I [bacterium]|nr:DNA-3-methyladenine glycosylase I [bacterium]
MIRTDGDTTRCAWCGTDPLYVAYHDEEWGLPMTADIRLFEKICLEGFQAGLSWITILKKREAFRAGFAGFDFKKVARFGEDDVERLVTDASIVRHRGKIESTINNAQRALELIEAEGSLATYFWRFEEERDGFPGFVPKTETSTRLSKDLRKRGWTFVGPTTAYAFMQAMGLVNDHVPGCHVREAVDAARRELTVP